MPWFNNRYNRFIRLFPNDVTRIDLHQGKALVQEGVRCRQERVRIVHESRVADVVLGVRDLRQPRADHLQLSGKQPS